MSEKNEDMIVTPWKVSGEVDYDRLIEQFGTQPITESLLERIKKHTGRGMALVKHLNTFSHGTDHRAAMIKINHVITNLTELTGRLFNNKGIMMELDLTEQDYELRNNAFIIQQILFMTLERVLTVADKGDIIKISARKENGGINITLNCRLSASVPNPDLDAVSDLAKSINGAVSMKTEGGDLRISYLISNLDFEQVEP